MSFIVNRIPSKTWNHLKMNGAKIDLEGPFAGKSPEVSFDAAEIAWSDAAGRPPEGARMDLAPLLGGEQIAYGETEAGTTMSRPLVLRYAYREGERSLAHLVLHAAEKSLLKAVVLLEAEPAMRETALLQTEIYADRDARIELSVVQLLGQEGFCLNHIGGICRENASFSLTRLELGAGKLYSGVDIDLQGKGSAFRTEIGYHAKTGQRLDMNYVARHMGRETTSEMDICGTLEKGSWKLFRGTIDFLRGCAGAKGAESEKVLLMADDGVNQTIPLILCKEEDVEGSHGASIGQLDDHVLFYLASRGIPAEEARQLIARARIEAVCQKIPDPDIRKKIHTFLGQGDQDEREDQ